MIVFELTMPNRGSWNNRWSLENEVHIKTMPNNMVPKELVGNDFWYNWEDGWAACIKVRKYDSRDKEYKSLKKRNTGFCGYDWMVSSILKHGEIRKPER